VIFVDRYHPDVRVELQGQGVELQFFIHNALKGDGFFGVPLPDGPALRTRVPTLKSVGLPRAANASLSLRDPYVTVTRKSRYPGDHIDVFPRSDPGLISYVETSGEPYLGAGGSGPPPRILGLDRHLDGSSLAGGNGGAVPGVGPEPQGMAVGEGDRGSRSP